MMTGVDVDNDVDDDDDVDVVNDIDDVNLHLSAASVWLK